MMSACRVMGFWSVACRAEAQTVHTRCLAMPSHQSCTSVFLILAGNVRRSTINLRRSATGPSTRSSCGMSTFKSLT